MFGKDKSRPDGLNTKCKTCVNESIKASRDRASKGIVKARPLRQIDLAQPKSTAYDIETQAVSFLMTSATLHGLEIQCWHDGTKSDCGVRAIGSSTDRWLPLQIKSTRRTTPTFSNCDKEYDCSIVGVALAEENTRVFLFDVDVVQRNKSNLSGKDIRIGLRESNVWKEFEFAPNDLWSKLLSRWQDGQGLPSRVLELQCPKNQQLEFCAQELAQMMDPERDIKLPIGRNGAVDRIVEGLRVQDKCAHVVANRGLHCRLACKNGSRTYHEGENDVYCIHFISMKYHLYFQWEISEEKLVKAGVITGTQRGSGALKLYVCKPDCDNQKMKDVQVDLFGGFPKRRSVSFWTAEHCRMMEIPESYVLPVELRESV